MILQKLRPRVKPVKFGKWEVQEFEVSEDNAILFNFKESLHGTTRTITSGKYIKLAHKGCLVMSNTPAELSELSPFERALKRYAVDDKPILINGLGLGIALQVALFYPCSEIYIIEIDKDLIKEISKYFPERKIRFINADALKYVAPKGLKYSVVWHDIWDTICLDNIPEMTTLHRKYGRRCDWQSSWSKDMIKIYCNRSWCRLWCRRRRDEIKQ